MKKFGLPLKLERTEIYLEFVQRLICVIPTWALGSCEFGFRLVHVCNIVCVHEHDVLKRTF